MDSVLGTYSLTKFLPIPAEKRRLDKMLFNLAPKSLNDPEGLAVTGVPEVHMFNYIFALLRHRP